jgi:hypothetical protein
MVDDERPADPPRGRGSWTGLHRSGSTRAARPSRADRVAALWQNSELDGVPVGDDTDGLPEPVAASDDAVLIADSPADEAADVAPPAADPELTGDSTDPAEPEKPAATSRPRIRTRVPVAERATPVAPAARPAADDDHAWLDDEAGPVVRPYTLTGGRSRPVTSGLGLLTHVESLFAPDADLVELQPEHRSILALTRTALSVAELSARLDLPVGVVRILVGDLLQANLVSTFEADAAMRAPDDDILQAVIDGLRSL